MNINSNPSDPYIQLGVRIQQSQQEELDAWCKKNRLARSVAIRQAIEALVNGGQVTPFRSSDEDLADRLSQLEEKFEALQRIVGYAGIF